MINITLTDKAAHYIKSRMQKEQGIGFRLSVKKTGCSGYAYAPMIVQEPNPTDLSFEAKQGVKVFVDVKWLEILQGLYIDYVEEEKAGLKQKRLVFLNPKETSRCGCGESFHIEND